MSFLDLRSLPPSELSLEERLAIAEPEFRKKLLARLSEEELGLIAGGYAWRYFARPDQLPPSEPWRVWAILAGRGAGKTRTGAEWVRTRGPLGRVGVLVGATPADARDLMVEDAEGPHSGVLAVSTPAERPIYEPSKRRLVWRNGAIAYIRSGADPEGLRGLTLDWGWLDEMAKWKYPQETWDNYRFALRGARNPQTVITTTPKRIPLIREIRAGRYPGTVLAPRVSTFRNVAHLDPGFLEELLAIYEGTRLGAQELYAIVLDDVEGALWTEAAIEAARWPFGRPVPELRRTIVSVDPPGSTAECGIVVVGTDALSPRPRAFVLDDRSLAGPPATWGRAVVHAAVDWGVDAVYVESNYGGQMAAHTIRTVPAEVDARSGKAYPAGDSLRIVEFTAKNSKASRAEPVAGLFEQSPSRVYLVGHFAELEAQMTSWVPGETPKSPDRLDALVHGCHELLLARSWKRTKTSGRQVAAARLPA